jgi:hypothetical protein
MAIRTVFHQFPRQRAKGIEPQKAITMLSARAGNWLMPTRASGRNDEDTRGNQATTRAVVTPFRFL